MMNARMAFAVDQTIVQITLAFILNLIAVISQQLEMNIFVQQTILVEKMKEIVILMMNAKMVLYVDLAIVQHHLVLIWKLIVVTMLHNVTAIVHLQLLVG